ncbi:MAG: ferritin-like domain-containing protein [Myxococcales bacterium]|nr:ferritin-like domain-containing protein [Myxococcales bacterium]
MPKDLPFRRRPAWPPYELLEQDVEEQARERLDRLERLYHKGQDQAWDGRAVLAELIEKHGPPRLPEHCKESALTVLSILLWGELAAWAISADLAERIEDIEAKMAATSQAHDEARHFYVLRDYLRAVGEPVPRLGGIGRRLLTGILETDSLVHKLVGMQLMVESNALSIFKAVGEAEIEPVLTELLPYYERDEARHVGLGVMYLPRLMAKMNRVELAGVAAFQLRCFGLLLSAGLPLRRHWEALGMDPRKMAARTVKLQDEIQAQMRELAAAEGDGAFGGLLKPGKGVGPAVLDFVHPPGGLAAAPPLNRALLDAWTRGAELMNQALA